MGRQEPSLFFPRVLATLIYMSKIPAYLLFLVVPLVMPLAQPLPSKLDPSTMILVAGGCFWCIEAVFEREPGVVRAVSGYAANAKGRPNYEQVSEGKSPWAEAVLIEFNPAQTSASKLLGLFMKAHDPTQVNRQGPDIGPQYRSAIFPLDARQKALVREVLAKTQKDWVKPLATGIEENAVFWPAEDYHQDFYEKNPNQGYCVALIKPKLEKLGKPTESLFELSPGQRNKTP